MFDLLIICSLRPWDPLNDVYQYEHGYCIQTKTRHRILTVGSTRNSVANITDQGVVSKAMRPRNRITRQSTTSQSTSPHRIASPSSAQDCNGHSRVDSDSSESYNGELS